MDFASFLEQSLTPNHACNITQYQYQEKKKQINPQRDTRGHEKIGEEIISRILHRKVVKMYKTVTTPNPDFTGR